MSNPSKPSKHYCETGETKYKEYHPDIHNYEDTPYDRCSEYYDEYKAYNSWVAEIVFESSKYKLIKYYYSENEGAFEITDDGITNKSGSFKYEIVDTQSGGGISFKDGENTTSTYTKLFFVIYNGTAKFADNNMKVRECTSTNNGSYTYEGVNGNSLTSIKFTNMKVNRSGLNAITGVEEAPPAEAPATKAAQVVPESSAAQTNQQAKATSQTVVAPTPVVLKVEQIPDAVKKFNGVTLRNNKGTIQVYIPDGYSIAAYDIIFNKDIEEISSDSKQLQTTIVYGQNTSNKILAISRRGKNGMIEYTSSLTFQDMIIIHDDKGPLVDAEITEVKLSYGGREVSNQIMNNDGTIKK